MAGIGDLLFNMWQPDPEQAIGQWSDAQQAQNRRAIGLDANGNPIPQPAEPAAAPDGGDQAAVQAQSASTLPPGQEPNATKTPVSLGHLLMNLQQRNEADQGLNQALGQGFAAFAQPRDREMVSRMFNVDQPNVNQTGATQMNLAGQQQGQDRMNALGAMVRGDQGKAIAQRLNISQDELIARYQADPQGVGNMIQSFAAPTDPMKNIEQITAWQNQLKGKTPGATPGDLSLLTPSLVAAVGPEFAQKAIGDAVAYRTTHGGQNAPWVGPGGVNVQLYNQWSKDQSTISDSQTTAAGTLANGVNKTNTLRQKLADLPNNPGLNKIISAPNDSPMKQAAWNALNDPDPNWQKNVAYSVLVNDPQALSAISELKEINGQEYTGAIDSLLGHGLRPSQTEVGAVREGFGQTKNLNLFGSMKDYKAQAIDPMLTRLDEAQATGYASAGSLKSMPANLRPFVDPVYLTGGKMHLDDGAAPESWESDVNKPMPPDLAAKAQALIAQQPGNAFAIRDGLRRKGYVVDF